MAQASQQVQNLHYKESLIAGYIAGVSGLLLGHPLDTLKVNLQSKCAFADIPGRNNHVPMQAETSSKTAMTMQRRMYSTAEMTLDGATKQMGVAMEKPTSFRSFLNLFSGIQAPMLTVGCVQSINFFLYESFKLHLRCHPGSQELDSLVHVGASSFAAGGIVSAITSPLAITKAKQQLMLWSFRRAALDTWSRKLSNTNVFSQVRNFYAGYSAHFFCDSVGRAVFFTSYEYMKHRVCKYKDVETPSILDRMASACVSGMLSMSVVYPIDVIRTKIYAHSAMFQGQPTPSPCQLAKDLWKLHGIKVFYRGLSLAVLRSGPVAAFALPVYDLVWESLTKERNMLA
mmetsp:Transcript_28691/g.41068  ORF Transcript_28691/g.41068 Transcript_28691/m.41068 type:complete len:343 (-) Transcript_28691:51-1079(-)|eukprot:CAMPEP_0172429424 /NCGR_PEP_ID=MMETSP1064-20121228/50263_1 /TAXON_ID=202472 /ORGANISM="Aulacoseira subarctica , Strain CCAP 1002/5" /LENGTH=342 /DNA_ID=CAMNT_0013174809 /DNA_START=127 /DNA_END=1155 /DNA_ORIENTATION=-